MTRPKLLLADDSVTIRDIVEQTFTDEGLDVTTATNGDEAMRRFVEVQPDILILDVNMPEPTGYKICEMIKEDESTRHIPVLLIVGSFEPFDQSEAERVGADGFLTKPFQSIRDLIVRVEELIDTQHRSASPAETADIDNLFDRSFSETVDEPAEESVEVLLSDTGTDDEIVAWSFDETTDGSAEDSVQVLLSDPGTHEEIVDPNLHEKIDGSSEESVEVLLGDPGTYEEIVDQKPHKTIDGFSEESVEVFLGDAGMDDEIIETSYPSREIAANDDLLILTKVGSGAGSLRGLEDAFQPPMMLDDGHGVIDFEQEEPSEEFIALVTRRVVEKLSDKVIREIAKEAVPQIAEKLIREALEEDKKELIVVAEARTK